MALGAFACLAVASTAAPPASACGWDYETYHAEAKSMPCVFDALLGYWPKHTDAYHEQRVQAFDHALAWMPHWTRGLDAKGISLLKLDRLSEAERVMKQRLSVAPDAYASHANLGTLYTFTGDFDAALVHIDRAMAIEPQAHFGREKYHRALVAYLQRGQTDPSVLTSETFVGVTPTARQRERGSKRMYAELGLEDDAIDALVAMLTVYGADELAEVYFALGELLALRGHRRLAYTAYRRAKELGHPRKSTAKRNMDRLHKVLRDEYYSDRAGDGDRGRGESSRHNRYRGIGQKYGSERGSAKALQRNYAAWEEAQLAEGLPVWTMDGLDSIYAHMNGLRRRCKTPRLIDDPLAPEAGEDSSVEANVPKGQPE